MLLLMFVVDGVDCVVVIVLRSESFTYTVHRRTGHFASLVHLPTGGQKEESERPTRERERGECIRLLESWLTRESCERDPDFFGNKVTDSKAPF